MDGHISDSIEPEKNGTGKTFLSNSAKCTQVWFSVCVRV